MPAPSVTYTFSNSTVADATEVNQNFTDLVNGVSDGTKDLSISALTCAGNVALNGNTTIGNASSDTLTVTASLASTIPIGTTNSYDIGGTSTGLRYAYFGHAGGSETARVASSTLAANIQLTLPDASGEIGLNATTAAVVSTTDWNTLSGATAGQWGDATSLSVAAGDWFIMGMGTWITAGANTSTYANLGVSTTSGNSGSGMTFGQHYVSTEITNDAGGGDQRTGAYIGFYISPSSTTTYYLKGLVDTSVTNLSFAGRIVAIRL